MTGSRFTEGGLTFHFDAGVEAGQYDGWRFFTGGFQNTCGGAKAVDFVARWDKTTYLIEVKDYRQHPRTKPSELPDEVAAKVRDSLAGLVAAGAGGNSAYGTIEPEERRLAHFCVSARRLRVVLHLEQPTHGRKGHRRLNPSNLKLGLKQRLRFIDAQPRVEHMDTTHAEHPWQVTSP